MRGDSNSPDELLVKVREAYSSASDNSSDSHPFPMGFDFALSLGYPVELLRSLPQSSVARFTGLSNGLSSLRFRQGPSSWTLAAAEAPLH